jgi:hypothetical protein
LVLRRLLVAPESVEDQSAQDRRQAYKQYPKSERQTKWSMATISSDAQQVSALRNFSITASDLRAIQRPEFLIRQPIQVIHGQ